MTDYKKFPSWIFRAMGRGLYDQKELLDKSIDAGEDFDIERLKSLETIELAIAWLAAVSKEIENSKPTIKTDPRVS